ncbi:MAG: D-alanine--D-alanine ligase, partial [Bacilli bacterium]|nr:D-alanine--D-alanine ligase [Bacilli bacterium]
MKIAVLFGSSSNEHEVSVVSAASIIKNLNKEKYEITPIYMDKENNFYLWHTNIEEVKPLKVGVLPTDIELISNPFAYLQSFDLIFMMIHGKNGEDGLLSSIFDFLNIKYIGNSPAASMITMDKIYTK